MSEFNGEALGRLFTVLGWDGSEFRNLKTDADGHVQVDVLAAALASGAATAEKQDSIIALLQTIDNLADALDSVGTDELDVNVESSVLPTDAATQTTLASLLSRFQDQAFTYRTRLMEIQIETVDSGTYYTASLSPAAGQVWVITRVGGKSSDFDPTRISFFIKPGGSGLYNIWTTADIDQYFPAHTELSVYLDEDDECLFQFQGGTSGDSVQSFVLGYIMGRD